MIREFQRGGNGYSNYQIQNFELFCCNNNHQQLLKGFAVFNHGTITKAMEVTAKGMDGIKSQIQYSNSSFQYICHEKGFGGRLDWAIISY